MNRVLIITARVASGDADILRSAIVGGCALALILAKVPLGL
jgi:hypothetical protein